MKILTVAVALFVATFCSPAVNAETFFLIELGAPLSIRDCTPDDYPPRQQSLCIKHTPEDALPWGQTKTEASLPMSAQFPWGPFHVFVSVFNGNVVEVEAITNGQGWQEQALADLTKKFGKPKSIKKTPLQNRTGAQFIGISAEWKLKAIAVKFRGVDGELDKGLIAVRTETAGAMDKAKADWYPANGPKL